MLQDRTLHFTAPTHSSSTQSIPITNKVETQTGIILSKNQFLRHKSSSHHQWQQSQYCRDGSWNLETQRAKSRDIVANIERKWRKHSINGKNRGYSTATVSIPLEVEREWSNAATAGHHYHKSFLIVWSEVGGPSLIRRKDPCFCPLLLTFAFCFAS